MVAPLEFEVEAAVNDLGPVGESQVLKLGDDLAAPGRVGELDPHRAVVGLRGVDPLHLVHRLHPALGARGARSPGAIAIDEILHLLELLLLPVERGLVDGESLHLLGEEGRIISRIGEEISEFQFEGLGDDPVEEVAIVARDDDRAGIGLEEIFEPLHAQQVEMVRRLVEQQDVVVEGEQPSEGQPHRPSARQRRHRVVELGDRET